MNGQGARAPRAGREPGVSPGRGGDLIGLAVFAAAGLALACSESQELLRGLSLDHRCRFGFTAFALMGALGRAVSDRLSGGRYPRPAALAAAALMWGLYGLAMALLIWLINGGVVMLQAVGLLPGGGLNLSAGLLVGALSSLYFTQPFFTSLFLNLGTVQPLLAALRLGREATELALAEGALPGLGRVAARVDWAAFIRRELRSIPLFRIPLLTAVFMLPQDLWLAVAAFVTPVLAALETFLFESGGSG